MRFQPKRRASIVSPKLPPLRSRVLGCRHAHRDAVSRSRPSSCRPSRAVWVKAGRRSSPEATRSGLDAGEHGGSLSEAGAGRTVRECGEESTHTVTSLYTLPEG